MHVPFPVQETIESRRSTRSYKMVAPAENVLAAIKNFASSLQVPFSHDVEVRFFNAEPTRALYPLMRSPPVNLAFLGETDLVSISKVGFI